MIKGINPVLLVTLEMRFAYRLILNDRSQPIHLLGSLCEIFKKLGVESCCIEYAFGKIFIF
jgi:hypothetical protein